MRHRAAAALALIVCLPAAIAAAQESNGLAGHDSRQPIEITSDTLTVEQPKQLATFAGNVDAVQGDMKLRADRLLVHYARNDQAGSGGAGSGSGTGGAAPADNSIRMIEAFGKVVITSPAESAQGDAGVYDVVAGTMQLTGDVVLTRGENVIRGNRLDMDLNTGLSTVSGGKRSERVRAVFTPENGGSEQP
ncbi:MAG TPA: lipopolysaccharide transport periplasmic protein LptA [Geminicoccus sp.]|uniref:lipopolysaccharide transport periplasmic protein LptA n=1 Tax=Geminicoccus sp. TaxID=2024832 RepID=UPI002C943E0C|nr:lipopolysaccharide transport periplasmic protein LptA [Geminicoccus sp.]HWL70538.1 lipopolysaccharide transport periplasmic protein LptA [Geminicoccus sp.]